MTFAPTPLRSKLENTLRPIPDFKTGTAPTTLYLANIPYFLGCGLSGKEIVDFANYLLEPAVRLYTPAVSNEAYIFTNAGQIIAVERVLTTLEVELRIPSWDEVIQYCTNYGVPRAAYVALPSEHPGVVEPYVLGQTKREELEMIKVNGTELPDPTYLMVTLIKNK